MSGECFDYKEYVLKQISDEIRIELSSGVSALCDTKELEEEIIKELNKTIMCLEEGFVRAHRASYFLSCDDGAESYLKKLKEDLEGLK